MVLESIIIRKEIFMKVNGFMVRKKGMEFYQLMVRFIKENGKQHENGNRLILFCKRRQILWLVYQLAKRWERNIRMEIRVNTVRLVEIR